MECFGKGFTKPLNPEIKESKSEGFVEPFWFCFFKVLLLGFLMKFAGSRKIAFGSQSGTYLPAKCEMSGACGEMPLSRFCEGKEQR